MLFETNQCPYLPKLYGIWDRVEDIDFQSLPNQFVLKTNHDGGGVVLVENKEMFLTNKKEFERAINKLKMHLRTNWYSLYREYHYKDIEPKVFAEELIDQNLSDFRFHQFSGETELIQVANSQHTHNDLYSSNWTKLDIAYLNHPTKTILDKPKNLEICLKIARILSREINYVRIDLFLYQEKIFVGELTFTPNGGTGVFKPDEVDVTLGKKFLLDKCIATKND